MISFLFFCSAFNLIVIAIGFAATHDEIEKIRSDMGGNIASRIFCEAKRISTLKEKMHSLRLESDQKISTNRGQISALHSAHDKLENRYNLLLEHLKLGVVSKSTNPEKIIKVRKTTKK